MASLYEKWMYAWETRLTTRDTNRVVRPLEWGLDWARRWPLVNGDCPVSEEVSEACEEYLHGLNDRIVAHSDEFFAYETPKDFRLETRKIELFPTGSNGTGKAPKGDGQFLRFTSPAPTPYPENDLVNARWFPAEGNRAVIVLPHWNANGIAYNALGPMLNRFGISMLRLSKPYHDIRRPRETERSDYAVSSNICRTIDATRQAVVDVRSCIDWLETQGKQSVGILGTSLGSCYAFIAAAHEPRLKVNVYNHASTYVADVTWTGQSTRHVREGLENDGLTLDRLRQLWLSISPMAYFDKFARVPKKCLMIYAKYDLTFLPELSRQAEAEFRRCGMDLKTVILPCGHYTTGETPFKYMDAYHMVRFLVKNL
ncbi:MAG TPA: alpha/beta hydrolase family protein [Verrucomicrobiae bacterium]|jgi:dienelactone hydrolase|nr:alpha/beta hydrolase family protein [Verrucomicrobiae bacterium]